MLSYEEIMKNKEIGKLIEFGYDLHKREMEVLSSVPTLELSNCNYCHIKEVSGGGVFGIRCFSDHSSCEVFTILGVSVCTKEKEGYNFEWGCTFEVNTKDSRVYISNLKKKNKYALEYDLENDWDDMPDEERVNLFIKAMEFLSFNKEDILAVLNKKMTAREAYMNVAPDEIKNMQWVTTNRRFYDFDGNVAVSGNFSSMHMDRFPFPFEEQPILDCSKVKTCCAYYEENYRKIKLINVNENRDSIIYTNLKNVIINELIDLSKVDATGTKFGHHTVINLENSIAKLKDMDLTLAVNENGERYITNDEGIVQFDDELSLTCYSNDKKHTNIKIFSNCDNFEMAKKAFDNDTDGIGLVRTEYILKNREDVIGMLRLLHYSENDKNKYLKRFKELQTNQVKDILENSMNKTVIFRLLDFKVKEFLDFYKLYSDDKGEYIESYRGASILDDYDDILNIQIEAMFEVFDGIDKDINLLVPLVKSSSQFDRIKKQIIKISENYNFKSLRIGAMIENIEMCNDADELAKLSDFISIGTNDLTESVTGLSRQSKSIEFYELDYKVKEVIEEAIYRARAVKPDIVIGICGEHSNYIENLKFLSSLDINYITCSPEFVKSNKQFLEINKEFNNDNKIKQLIKK